MGAPKTITIVGGGLSGLTLGIGLRQQGVPATILEAGNYPRHRVCGEFISGRGQATLARLGLGELFDRGGAVNARTTAFFSATQATTPRPLPSAAICLSRYTLDEALARKFRDLGGELIVNHRFTGDFGEGIVRATGRRPAGEENGVRWVGLKIHARNVPLAADLEMHVSASGYVGLCKINDGEVNICGLFRKRTGENGETKIGRDCLRGPAGSLLHERLATAKFDDASFCAVAGLSLQPHSATAHEEICLGDAVTMIPPVTGNGMSMAFESAELALAPLAAWSRGESSWPEAREKIASDCDATFAKRLALAKWLQRLILTPVWQNPLVALAARSDSFWRLAFEHTR
jgi:2-polyprenyl-6-methoxyphenol hydroxylase-like FAD-dependent oxidoreductase